VGILRRRAQELRTDLNRVLKEIQAGKEGAFDRFLELVQDIVYSFGVKVCGEREDAKDTLQETLVKAFQALPGLEMTNAKALKVWLYKVAKNSCLMMRRRQKSEPARKLTLEEITPSRIGETSSIEIPDISSIPIETLLQKETRSIVQKAILLLPYHYRIVLVMRDLEQLSTKETSEILGISHDTVKIRLHRARLFLRKELEKYFPESERHRKSVESKIKVTISPEVKHKLQKSFQQFSIKKRSEP
jgi:RNA polymerase sigma-70 factor, ECF subfamily